jgi:hypothetical protein
MSTSFILWSIFLGAIGIAYITYGKQQRKAIPILGGIILLILPYFTVNSYLLSAGLITVIGLSYFINV